MDNLIVLDCEVYPNYFLTAFKNLTNNKTVFIECRGADNKLDDENLKKLQAIMLKRLTFGFNSTNYDLPIIFYALRGMTCNDIYKLSKNIIENGLKGWQTFQMINLSLPNIKHFDIKEPSPSVHTSLKSYGARIHSTQLKDLPIEPNKHLTDDECDEIREYCVNDLNTTIDLYNKIADRIKLRFDISKEYKQDLTSKSDAQIAECIIKSEIKKIHPSKYLKAPKLSNDLTLRYTAPSFIQFKTDILKNALNTITNHDFELDGKGSIKLPSDLKKLKIDLGFSTYQLGIGGIHSTENKQCIIPSDDYFLIDKDVVSYYPSIILNSKLYPKHLGETFLNIYGDIVKKRIKAKKEGNDIVNQSLKIVINGSFGKLGSKYSALYSPDLLMQTTLTGQLSLLMLIESLELENISVVSANTDGFVSLVHKDKMAIYEKICQEWEQKTKFNLERNEYKALYSRDVNNYLAITKDDKAKGKGIFSVNELSKNPHGNISIIAVKKLLTENKSIKETILNCKDLRLFLFARQVKGGAVWRNEYLGKVVRWVYVKQGDTITYKTNGNKVPKSANSMPIMNLSDDFSFDNLDYERYIQESIDILDDLGYFEL